MKRLIAIAVVAIAMLSASGAYAQKYKGRAMTTELKKDLRVQVQNTSAWRTRVSGKPGDKMRPFTASSIRKAGPNHYVGFRVTGKFSTKSGRTYVKGVAVP